MKPTIAQLWNGEIAPIQYFKEHNPEIKNLEDLMQRNLEKLEPHLSETAQKTVKVYNDCITEYIYLVIQQAFSEGYSIGTRLLLEALADDDE